MSVFILWNGEACYHTQASTYRKRSLFFNCRSQVLAQQDRVSLWDTRIQYRTGPVVWQSPNIGWGKSNFPSCSHSPAVTVTRYTTSSSGGRLSKAKWLLADASKRGQTQTFSLPGGDSKVPFLSPLFLHLLTEFVSVILLLADSLLGLRL